MRRFVIAASVAAFLLFGILKDADAQQYLAIITGSQEVPPVDTDALAISFLEFVAGGQALVSFRINLNLEQTIENGHIHLAPAGQDGDIVLDFFAGVFFDIGNLTIYVNGANELTGPLEGFGMGVLNFFMSLGQTYVNLHTAENPGGYIRGQIFLFPAGEVLDDPDAFFQQYGLQDLNPQRRAVLLGLVRRFAGSN